MENKQLAQIMQRAGAHLYSYKSSHAKYNARENLAGRNYYCTEETMRYFGARISIAREECDGLLFLVIDSTYLDFNKTKRGFRYAIFDIYGDEVARLDIDKAYKTSDQALKQAKKVLESFSLPEYYAAKITAQAKRKQRQYYDCLDLAAQIEGANELKAA